MGGGEGNFAEVMKAVGSGGKTVHFSTEPGEHKTGDGQNSQV